MGHLHDMLLQHLQSVGRAPLNKPINTANGTIPSKPLTDGFLLESLAVCSPGNERKTPPPDPHPCSATQELQLGPRQRDDQALRIGTEGIC